MANKLSCSAGARAGGSLVNPRDGVALDAVGCGEAGQSYVDTSKVCLWSRRSSSCRAIRRAEADHVSGDRKGVAAGT